MQQEYEIYKKRTKMNVNRMPDNISTEVTGAYTLLFEDSIYNFNKGSITIFFKQLVRRWNLNP